MGRIFSKVVVASLLLSCNNSKPVNIKGIKNDTLKTIAAFRDSSGTKIDYVFRVLKSNVIVDSTLKAKIVRDTIFFLPTFTPILDTATHKQKKDSTGAPMYDIKFRYDSTRKSVLWYANVNIDSILKLK